MIKTKTVIEKQLSRKSNKNIVETIRTAKKNKNWQEVAGILSAPRKNKINLNLGEIDRIAKDGEIIVVAGKVLSEGEINKKIKIVAESFSEKAKEKLLKCKCEVSTITEELKKNPEAKGIRILK